jgi:hypothetical protein
MCNIRGRVKHEKFIEISVLTNSPFVVKYHMKNCIIILHQNKEQTPMTSPGRPPKPDGKKRQPLHISLYAEDLERLEQLTDNRSEFIRGCIERAWEEEHGEEVTLTLTLPKWLIEDLVKAVADQLPPQQASMVKLLARGLLANTAASKTNGTGGHG